MAANKLNNFLQANSALIAVMAGGCGNEDLRQFNLSDLSTWDREMTLLSGISFSGAKQ